MPHLNTETVKMKHFSWLPVTKSDIHSRLHPVSTTDQFMQVNIPMHKFVFFSQI
jgi:hypothetical protein